MNEKSKTWILLIINNAPEKRGLAVETLIRDRPDFVEKDVGTFMELLNELRKDGLIEPSTRTVMSAYKITSAGKMELGKYLNKLGILDYLSLVKTIPQAEARYRLNVIENFLTGVVLASIFGALLWWFWRSGEISPVILFFTTSLFFFSTFLIVFGVLHLLLNFLKRLIYNISESAREAVMNYYQLISVFVIIVVIIVIVYLSRTLIAQYLPQLIGGVVLLILANAKVIKRKIDEFLLVLTKKRQE